MFWFISFSKIFVVINVAVKLSIKNDFYQYVIVCILIDRWEINPTAINL